MIKELFKLFLSDIRDGGRDSYDLLIAALC